ncbi:MAG: organic solvent tolerance protein [Rhodospirillaceae bacterium]|nr:organic solvent tolerance protein [Rhodospirillaceae bacterium]
MRLLRSALFALLLATLAAAPAGAEEQQPLLLQAHTLSYDQERGIVTAEGDVELATGERILRARRVSYDQRRDVVTASGEVAILEPSGEVLFAEFAELRDQLRNGFVRGIRLLLTDRSRLAARGAQRRDGNRTEMDRAVFSACQLCPDHPQRPPLWQLKAVKVIHHQTAQRIDYEDAFLEVYGIPIAYTPFFSHPDPTVKRRSGFLTPTYGSSTELGLKLVTPYHFVLGPHRDATFQPLFTSKEGVVLAGEYRERTQTGGYQVSASATHVDRRNEDNVKTGGGHNRGHIKTVGSFDLDKTWRWGFAGERSSDDTYLRRYDFSSADTLTSNLFLEGFRDRNYAAANAFSFQGLGREDDPGNTPIVLPELEYHFVGEPGRLGQRLELDANALVLERTDGADSRRLSLSGGWHLPSTTPGGLVYAFKTSLRGDLYHVDRVIDPANPTGTRQQGFVGRLLPQTSVDVRYPLVRNEGQVRQTVEPIAMLIAAPYGGNPDKISNEDSASFEYDDTNLFSLNRFAGLDRWEGGPRLNYGVKLGAYGEGGGHSTAMIGQVLRARAGSAFADKTGLENKRSDYVARINVTPGPYLDYSHRMRMDRDTWSIRRTEIDLSLGPKALRFNAGYVSLSRELTTDELESREELRLSGRARFTRNWGATASTRRDLAENRGTIASGFGLDYIDECLEFTTRFERTFTSDRDVRPSTGISIRVKLKHLG